jgi:hypothetical protein
LLSWCQPLFLRKLKIQKVLHHLQHNKNMHKTKV